MKGTPEEIAAKMAAKLRDTHERAAAATVEWSIGRLVLEMLARGEIISRQSLIAAFEASGEESKGAAIEAKACITALRASEEAQGR